jgi:hypothetical protein
MRSSHQAVCFRSARSVFAGIAFLLLCGGPGDAQTPEQYQLNDTHFHLTNYVQQGIDVRDFLKIMGDKVGRVALFGIPLQQTWSHRIDGNRGPTYYLQSDAPLYYYSFTDAWIAMAYKSLPPEHQARFDPMITGFNPADMYAADHIRRVLQTFPGVFSGIGEFTIHKEFVSAKVAGEVASLQDPALDRILDLAAEVGLVVLIHNDIDTPFSQYQSDPSAPKVARAGEPHYFEQIKALFKRHPRTTIIWAHTGMGRIVHPVKQHAAALEELLKDPAFKHVHFDISWDEVAKYLVATPESRQISAELINRYPDRFLFGTDEVAPRSQEKYLKTFYKYEPLWRLLDKETSQKVRVGNYQRIFDAARSKVRAWEKAQSSGRENPIAQTKSTTNR